MCDIVRRNFILAITFTLFLSFSVSEARAEKPKDTAKAKANEALLQEVSKRILAVTDPAPGFVWPPTFQVMDEDDINAFASARIEIDDKEVGDKRFKVKPFIVVLSGMMNQVIKTEKDPDPNGAPDRLAYIVGHELGHVILNHITRPREKKSEFTRLLFSRDQEIAADVKGAELALKAGYSTKKGLETIRRMQKLGLEYSSFEGLKVDHPSWNDRLAHIDKEQAKLWKTMSAFHNGTYFLMCEQYVAGEACFRRVTEEFPKCHEAWTNLGFALLMQYCDGLDVNDLRQFKLGQLIVGGFYRRPQSLEPLTRGRDEKLWEEAVAAFQKSLTLQPTEVLPKADLGIAYLVHPSGKPDLQKAQPFLQEAAARAAKDDTLEPWMRATILLNAGVADLAGQRPEECAKRFEQGEQIARRSFADGRRTAVAPMFGIALLYNNSLLLAASPDKAKRMQALEQLETYLVVANPASAWWPLAYERYTGLCKEQGKAPKPKKELTLDSGSRFRQVAALKLASGMVLTLSEPINASVRNLGEKIPVASRTKLTRLCYPQHGVEVLATDTILAICLKGPKAPPLPLQGQGSAAPTVQLTIGMTKADLEKLLEGQDYDFRQLDDPSLTYRFYGALGLGVRLEKNKVSELVIAQIPRRRSFD